MLSLGRLNTSIDWSVVVHAYGDPTATNWYLRQVYCLHALHMLMCCSVQCCVFALSEHAPSFRADVLLHRHYSFSKMAVRRYIEGLACSAGCGLPYWLRPFQCPMSLSGLADSVSSSASNHHLCILIHTTSITTLPVSSIRCCMCPLSRVHPA